MDSTFRTSDTLGVGVASASAPSQVQGSGWAFNHDSSSFLQDAAATVGDLEWGMGGCEQFWDIQVALEQVIGGGYVRDISFRPRTSRPRESVSFCS